MEIAGLLKAGPRYCVSTTNTGSSSYEAFSQSSSGKVWTATDRATKPVIYTGTLPADCQFITEGVTSPAPTSSPTATPTATATPTPPPVEAYVDPTPTRTVFTYRCDVATTGEIPLQTNLTGRESWSDGPYRDYNNAAVPNFRTFVAGQTYVMTFEGTYKSISALTDYSQNLSKCLRSVDHLGSGTGVTSGNYAFFSATGLSSVPKYIPSTLTVVSSMFRGATIFNDPNVGLWDVSGITTMQAMFQDASNFNQPLNSWDTSKVTKMHYMFTGASKFNQPIGTFNTAQVTSMAYMFSGATAFNQPLDSWITSNLTVTTNMFAGATAFNQSLNSWDMSNVTNMQAMFQNASSFNGDIRGWNVSKVTNMTTMIGGATSFNRDLSGWNTIAVTAGTTFASASFPTEYLPPRTSK